MLGGNIRDSDRVAKSVYGWLTVAIVIAFVKAFIIIILSVKK